MANVNDNACAGFCEDEHGEVDVEADTGRVAQLVVGVMMGARAAAGGGTGKLEMRRVLRFLFSVEVKDEGDTVQQTDRIAQLAIE